MYFSYVIVIILGLLLDREAISLTLIWFIFFFKQKTAYEMRISDWSSDVCSSDLPCRRGRRRWHVRRNLAPASAAGSRKAVGSRGARAAPKDAKHRPERREMHRGGRYKYRLARSACRRLPAAHLPPCVRLRLRTSCSAAFDRAAGSRRRHRRCAVW